MPFISSISSCSAIVQGSGSEGVGVIARGCPNADIEVESLTSGRVRRCHIKSGLDGVARASADCVPLGDVLLLGDAQASAVLPGIAAPVTKVVVPGIDQPLAFALDGMLST